MSTSIFDVAKFFLSKNDQHMTHKKLQKLCYYAYAWHLTLKGERLFSERFQAWVHGPVSPELYQKYKGQGWNVLPAEDEPILTAEEKRLLEEIYRAYGQFTGDELEALTHSELPWIKARQGLPAYEPSTAYINDEIIKDYYSKLYEQGQND